MKLALKQDSPEKQKKTIEHFIRRQKAHQQRKDLQLDVKRTEQHISVTGRSKQRNLSNDRSTSKGQNRSKDQSRGKSNKSKIGRLTGYIE
jgi:hypothetical protein